VRESPSTSSRAVPSATGCGNVTGMPKSASGDRISQRHAREMRTALRKLCKDMDWASWGPMSSPEPDTGARPSGRRVPAERG
jgi:hypothetical protein